MALSIFELFGTLAVRNGEANEAIDQTVDKARDAQTSISNVARGLERAFAVAAAAVAALGVKAVKYNATIEQYTTSFQVMTGSAEKAAEVTERLQELGAATPFELTDLADATQLLMNYGFTADDAVDSMLMLGDIAQGSADKMNRIAMAYGQMSSAGKVSLEDVKQMIEAGFNPLQEIASSTGESMESLYARISEGTLTVDEITAAMERATSAGGKYFQSMEKQSQTLSGKWSTLKDTASQALGTITAGLSEWLSSEGIPAAIEAVEWLEENFDDLIPTIEAVAAAGATIYVSMKIPEMISGLKSIVSAFSSWYGIIGLVAAALVALTIGVGNHVTALINSGEAYSGLSDKEREFIDNTQAAVRSWNERKAAADESIATYMTEMNGISKLVDELQGLADESGNVAEKDRERAEVILGILNDALGTEYEMVDGQIQQYGELVESIDQVIAAKMREYAINEMMPAYIEALGMQDDGINAIRISSEELAAQEQRTAEARIAAQNSTSIELQIEATKQENTLAEMQANHDELVAGWINGQTTIQNMNQLTSLSADATQEEIAEALMTTEEDMQSAELVLNGSLANIGDAAELMGTRTTGSLGMVETGFENMSATADTETNSVISTMRDSDFYSPALDLANEVEDGFKPDLYQGGVNAIEGAERGMESRRGSLIRKIADIASAAYRQWNWSFQIYSPSRIMKKSGEYIMEGAEEGINAKAGDVIRSMSNVARNVQEAFDPTLNQGEYSLNSESGIEAIDAYATAQKQSMQSADMQTAETNNGTDEIRELKDQFRDFVEDLPGMMVDAFATMKFDVNNREFARLVKAVN